MTTCNLFLTAGGVPAPFQEIVGFPSGAAYESDARGFIANVPIGDVGSLISAGCVYALTQPGFYAPGIIPAAATVAAYVSSVALANGTLSIAAQPEVMRPAQFVVGAGASAITAGNLAVTYQANDGTLQTDNFSLSTASAGTSTLVTSKGVDKLVSPIVTGLTGGTSPYIYGGSNGTLAVPVPQTSTSLTLTKETNAGADVAVGSLGATGIWTPHAAPNGTLTFTAGYSYLG